jgi:PfaB family protein
MQIIGFDAHIGTLENIDQVETVLYCGSALAQQETEFCFESAINQLIDRILLANCLDASQIDLILVGTPSNLALIFNSYRFATTQKVTHLSEALHLSKKQTTNDERASLLLSVHDVNSYIKQKQSVSESEFSTISFDVQFDCYQTHNGVAAILLANSTFTKKQNSVIYALLDDIKAKELTAKITTLEVSASADEALRKLEELKLLTSYKSDQTLHCAVSCQKSVLGENAVLSELLGFIHVVIGLYQRYRPAIQGWKAPHDAQLEKWQNSPYYLFNQAAPVFPTDVERYSAFSCVNNESQNFMILKEFDDALAHPNGFNRYSSQSLFLFSANNEQQLIGKLTSFKLSENIKSTSQALYQEYCSTDKFTVVLIAQSFDELEKERAQALIGVAQAFYKKSDWKTPKGSYFTSQGAIDPKIAFSYPGIGATYVGLGRDLFHLFPEIYPSILKIADNIGASLKDPLLNPRSVIALDFKALKERDLALRNDLANIAECGVGYACVFTKIFEEVFAIKADFASGYSMGEISMFAALGCWQQPGLMSARLANSDTFNHQLSNELNALRKYWNLPSRREGNSEPIWETYSIKGTVEQVQAAINRDDRVYITIINTADSLVIGGYPADCLKVIERLGVRAMPMKMANAIHSAPAYQEYDNMLDLYSMDVTDRITTKMISTSCYLPIPQLQKAIAVSISKCLCEPVDFPRLINELSKKGCNVFIEMGAGRSLSSWTDKILKQENPEHISVPINAKGTNDQLTYARAIAKLISFGVKVDLQSYFTGSLIQQVKRK